MMQGFFTLTSSALALPVESDARALPEALGPGSVVFIYDDPPASPIPREIYVCYADVKGQTHAGWLAQRTPMKASAATKGAQHVPYDPASPITAWDSLRERFAKRPFPGWSFRAWGASLKGPKDLALVRLALRELGATCEEKAAASTLVTTLMRVIFTPQEVRSMSAEATEVSTAAAAKKPTAKKAATKKPAEKDAPARSMSRSVGQALKDAGFASPLVSKLLKDEKVTKTQLTELRDAINTKASALRDADKGAAASKLSAANKLVRRLSRTK